MVSKYAIKGLDVDKYKIRVIAVSKLEEMYQRLVG
jgi:DNA repair protein RadA/Sms